MTNQVVWGGGEVLLIQIADELLRRQRPVGLRASVGSQSALRRPDLIRAAESIRRPALIIANEFGTLWRSWVRHPLTPHVFLVHGEWQTSRLRNLFVSLSRARAFAVSVSVARAYAASSLLAPRKIPVLPLGPDREHFHPPSPAERADRRRQLGLGEDFTALYVGRLQDVKRLDLFAASVVEAGCRGLIVCPSPTTPTERRLLDEALAAAEDASSRLIVRHDMDVRDAYWAADIMLSTSEFESLGVAMMEALACGLPVVTTAVGGPSDFLVHQENGLQLPPTSTASMLGEVLRSLASERMLLASMSRAAKASGEGRGVPQSLDVIIGS